MPWHVIKKGETLSGLAAKHGLKSWQTIYQHPNNAVFRKNRPDPDRIQPGDRVYVPNPRLRRHPSAVDNKHQFRVRTPKVQPPALEAEVLEVRWKSGIKAALAKTTIKAPHWKKGTNVLDGNGSKRAGVYLIESKGGSHDVDVKVKVTKSENVSGTGKLLGSLGSLSVEGTCPTAVGEHTVAAKIKKLPDKISWTRGDATWGLEVSSASLSVSLKNKTRLEVFTILAAPAGFYTKGVWVEALRFLCDKVGATGVKSSRMAIQKITRHCHGGHGLRYDTTSGAPAYGAGPSGGTFKLDKYIKASLKVVNCYDQAAAVQALAGALGIAGKWSYQGRPPGLKSFGLIKVTDLVGVGSCNNPFFKSNGSAKIVASTDPKRTGFGNHAFIDLGGRILDACAGPHVATETPTQYLSASVDFAEMTRRGLTAAQAADITFKAGVTKVE